jgi:hypothetical protein
MPTLGMQGLLELLGLQSQAAARAARAMQADFQRLVQLQVQRDHPGQPDVEQLAADVARRLYVVVLGVSHYRQALGDSAMILVDLEGMLLLASRLETATGAEREDIIQQLRHHVAAWQQHDGEPTKHRAEALRVQVLTLGIFWVDGGRAQLQTVIQGEVPLQQLPGALFPTLCGGGRGSYWALWESARTAGMVDGVWMMPSIRKSVMKVLPAAFTTHFMGGTTDLYPVAPQVGTGECAGCQPKPLANSACFWVLSGCKGLAACSSCVLTPGFSFRMQHMSRNVGPCYVPLLA